MAARSYNKNTADRLFNAARFGTMTQGQRQEIKNDCYRIMQLMEEETS